MGLKAGGLHFAMTTSAIDPRVGQKNINTAYGKYEAVTVDVYKDPVSVQAADTAKVLIPELSKALVEALVAQGILGALGEAASGLGNGSDSPVPVPEGTQ